MIEKYGFISVADTPVEELGGVLRELRHKETGARVAWLDRASDNKTFGIAFRTVPEDDTGVFHILEHSVLCGSRRYPVKEPFVELMKSSMKTFLNAMTFPDKTFYPVSSRNDKDFVNLMRIYLDAVFFPAIYEKPEIFYQEGWHYELRAGQAPCYKGVVFNEMKGALSSPDAIMRNALNRILFPDTCYRFVSGGDPAHIPELSYERFIAAHKRFYHPSNAYIFLDGSVDLELILKILSEEFLCRFTYREPEAQIAYQKPVAAGTHTCYYEVSPNEKLGKRARTAWAFGLGDYTDRLELTAMQALAQLLSGSNESPLKQQILSLELAENVNLGVMSGLQQNYVVLSADNFREDQGQQIKDKLLDILAQQIRDGLDRQHLKAILSNMEFQERERDYGYMPQGIGLGMNVLGSWLYGGEPAANLSVAPLFAQLHSLVDSGWYEQLLEKVFFSNPHTGQVLLLPSHTLGQEKVAREQMQLEKALEHSDRQAWLAQLEKLDAWQTSADTPEDISKLPRLALSDISPDPEDIPRVEKIIDGVTVLHHPLSTGGIGYWRLYFDISDLREDALAHIALLCQILGKLGTKQHSAMQLQKQRSMDVGNMDFWVTAHSCRNVPEVCRSFLCVSFSALEEKLPQAIKLVLEILTETDFTCTDPLKTMLQQAKTGMENMVVGSGHQIGMLRTLAGISAEGVVQECTGGYSYLQALKAMQVADLPEILENYCKKVFTTGRMLMSATGKLDERLIEDLIAGLAVTQRKPILCAAKPWGPRKEGVIIPADISFAVQTGPCLYNGHMQVAAQIASLAYLWNAVRVQGGAYGAGLSISDSGCGTFYSYRDPNSIRSLGQYQHTADFVRNFAASQPDLTGFIIGTIAGTEPVLLPGKQGAMSDAWYLKGISYEDRCRDRRNILSMTAADLAAVEGTLRSLCASSGICVVGSKAHVEACGLDQVYTL